MNSTLNQRIDGLLDGERGDGYCVSIYVPLPRSGDQIKQTAIRLKNMVREARARLVALDVAPEEADALLAPVRAWAAEQPFWEASPAGIALFAGAGRFDALTTPDPVQEHLFVGDAFYLLPLIALLREEARFFILALTREEAHLLACTRREVREVLHPELPTSLEVITADEVYERQLQFRAGQGGTPAAYRGGRGAAIFHGQEADDDPSDRIRRYYQLVARGVDAALGESQDPLVLAAVKEMAAIYRKVGARAGLLAEEMRGSPEGVRLEGLRDCAWPMVREHLRQGEERALVRLHDLSTTDRVLGDPEDAASKAAVGQVDTLWVGLDAGPLPGTFDPARQRAVAVPDGEQATTMDLLDFAARNTHRNGGQVIAVPAAEVPLGGTVAALLRF